jgi:hypothetical protein
MIYFDEKKHSYTNVKTKEKYISATTLIGKFKKPFDVDKHSKRVADREGISQEEIKERWQQVNKEACDYGTSIHLVMENWLHSQPVNDEDKELYVKPMEQIWEPDRKIIEPEKRLWNHEHKIAGTTDVFEDNEKYFNLYDFKTNKRFTFNNMYGEYMLGPLSHLPECQFSTYSLQLSLYAYMQSILTGQTVGELACFYYDRDLKTWTKHNTPYMKLEVTAMLDAWKNKNS